MAYEKAYALLDVYKREYKNLYGKDLPINKYRLKWAAEEIVKEYGLERAQAVALFFLESYPSPQNIALFFRSFDDWDNALRAKEEDARIRAEQRRKMYEAMKEEGYGSQR